MVDTLEILRKELRGKDGTLPRIRLMMGSDQALQFTKWHEWKRILDYATPVVVLRPPFTRNSFARALADRDGDDLQARSWLSWTLDLVPDDISSQEIRKRIIAGEDVSDMIPPSVIEYITKHRLYQPPAPQPQPAPSPPPSTESTPRNMAEPGPRSGKDEEPHDRYSPFS